MADYQKKITQRDVLTLPDGKYRLDSGVYLRVQGPRRRYIFRYQLRGKRAEVGIGGVQDVTLARAKVIALRLRQEVAEGRDPKETLLAEKAPAVRTFDQVYPEAIEATCQSRAWKNEKHRKQWHSTISTYASPVIGAKPISSITRDDILAVLSPIWREKPETASRLRGRLERVFSYAIWSGEYTGANPAVYKDGLDMVLPSLSSFHDVRHHEALSIEEAKLVCADFWRRGRISHMAVLFGLLTALRAQEFCRAQWSEVDFAERIFTVPRERQKVDQGAGFRVPLSDQAMAVLEACRTADPDMEGFIFKSPNRSRKSICLETPRMILMKRLCHRVTMHGCRSTFRDWAAENSKNPRVAEKCLMHQIGSVVEQAYQRSDLLEMRRTLLQEWADEVLPMSVIRGEEAQE